MTTFPTLFSGAIAPGSVQLLQDLSSVFRTAGEGLLNRPDSASVIVPAARERLQDLLKGVPAISGPGDPLKYPLRAARRFVGGEVYGATRFRALERSLLARLHYLRGYRDALETVENDRPPDTLVGQDQTLPSPPATTSASRPPTFEECRDRIERAAELAVPLPEFLDFVDLLRGEARKDYEKSVPIAAKVIDLPMQTVLERIFSRTFRLPENRGDFPDYWAENISLTASLPQPEKPSVRIACDLQSTSEGLAFVLALQALLGIKTNPIEILLKGHFEWREGSLYIPLKPFQLSQGAIPDNLFGAVTPILVPIAPDRTVFAIEMEDKILSKNPLVFVEAMARGILI
ncbi:MAG TPA: hypothetical protein VFX30_03910 [bacterium]|nr:hypothetical protein [bacterium]